MGESLVSTEYILPCAGELRESGELQPVGMEGSDDTCPLESLALITHLSLTSMERDLLGASVAIYTGVQREMSVSPATKCQQLVGKE